MNSLKELSSKTVLSRLNDECLNSVLEEYRKKHTVYSAYALYPFTMRFLGVIKDENIEKCKDMILADEEDRKKRGKKKTIKGLPKPFILPHALSPNFPIDKVYLISSQSTPQFVVVTNDTKKFKKIAKVSDDLYIPNTEGLSDNQHFVDDDGEEYENYHNKLETLWNTEPERFIVKIQ